MSAGRLYCLYLLNRMAPFGHGPLNDLCDPGQ